MRWKDGWLVKRRAAARSLNIRLMEADNGVDATLREHSLTESETIEHSWE